MSRNRIGLEGAIALASALVQDVHLLGLDLRANPLTSVGVERLVDALDVNATLLKFELPLAELDGKSDDLLPQIMQKLERNDRVKKAQDSMKLLGKRDRVTETEAFVADDTTANSKQKIAGELVGV